MRPLTNDPRLAKLFGGETGGLLHPVDIKAANSNISSSSFSTFINYNTPLLPTWIPHHPASPEPADSEVVKSMSDPTREEIQAQIAASEARGDTKIARFEGKLDLVLAKLDSTNEKMNDVKDDIRSARANQWVIAFGLAVLIVAVAGLFPVFFGLGSQLRDMVHSEIQSQIPPNSNGKK